MRTEPQGAVRLFMSISLDGYVATADGDVSPLYPDLGELRHREPLRGMIAATGAVIMGRRAYDMGDTDDGYVDYEHQVPIFVLTHRPPEVPARHDPAKGLSFTFVTEGPQAAVARAKEAAGGKDVQVIGGASTGRQLLEAGLLDEIHLSFVPVLLGSGLRLFDDAPAPAPLAQIGVLESAGRVDVRYRVARA